MRSAYISDAVGGRFTSTFTVSGDEGWYCMVAQPANAAIAAQTETKRTMVFIKWNEGRNPGLSLARRRTGRWTPRRTSPNDDKTSAAGVPTLCDRNLRSDNATRAGGARARCHR